MYTINVCFTCSHVLTHYLLWYEPPVVVIQRALLLPQHRCTLPCTFSLLEKTLQKFYNGCKKTRCASFPNFPIDQKLFLTFYRFKIKTISRFFIGHEPDIRGTAFQFSENQTATPVWKVLSFTRLDIEKKP